jgi:hypothetical protein
LEWYWIQPAIKVPQFRAITAVSSDPRRLAVFTVDVGQKVIYSEWSADNPAIAPWTSWIQVPTSPSCYFVAGIADGSGRIDLFTIENTPTGSMWSTWKQEGGGWAPWFTIGVPDVPDTPKLDPVTSRPVMVTRPPGYLDLFAQANRNQDIFATRRDPNSGIWQPWYRIDGPSQKIWSALSVVARDADHLDIFAVDKSGQVVTKGWAANRTPDWRPWSIVGLGPFLEPTETRPQDLSQRSRESPIN